MPLLELILPSRRLNGQELVPKRSKEKKISQPSSTKKKRKRQRRSGTGGTSGTANESEGVTEQATRLAGLNASTLKNTAVEILDIGREEDDVVISTINPPCKKQRPNRSDGWKFFSTRYWDNDEPPGKGCYAKCKLCNGILKVANTTNLHVTWIRNMPVRWSKMHKLVNY